MGIRKNNLTNSLLPDPKKKKKKQFSFESKNFTATPIHTHALWPLMGVTSAVFLVVGKVNVRQCSSTTPSLQPLVNKPLTCTTMNYTSKGPGPSGNSNQYWKNDPMNTCPKIGLSSG